MKPNANLKVVLIAGAVAMKDEMGSVPEAATFSDIVSQALDGVLKSGGLVFGTVL